VVIFFCSQEGSANIKVWETLG